MVGDKAIIAEVQTVATISGMIPPPTLKKKSANGHPQEFDLFFEIQYEPLKEPLPKKESVPVLINCAVC